MVHTGPSSLKDGGKGTGSSKGTCVRENYENRRGYMRSCLKKTDEYKQQVKLGARGLGVGRGKCVCERETEGQKECIQVHRCGQLLEADSYFVALF